MMFLLDAKGVAVIAGFLSIVASIVYLKKEAVVESVVETFDNTVDGLNDELTNPLAEPGHAIGVSLYDMTHEEPEKWYGDYVDGVYQGWLPSSHPIFDEIG